MYVPAAFREERPEVLGRLIAEYPLGVLVTLGAEGLNANHVPFLLDPDPAPFGTLRAHVARANPVWRDLARNVEPLVVFQGPQAYVTPSWYPRKQESGKVVPTWNYLVVHAYGPLRVIEDPAWLRAFVSRLTDRFETRRAQPWKVDDAPEDYVQAMLKAIVGLEMPVTRLIGKWKASQNQPAADRAGALRGLASEPDPAAVALAEWMKRA